ncbi:MAG TPA: hypothetical protein VGA22_09970 [Gemmatimonadales bacterium]|jgi:hypothetical protein
MESYQIYNLVEALIVMFGVLGVSGIGAWVLVKRRRHSELQAADPALLSVLEQLRASVDGMREDVADMADRLEFTERAMAQLAEQKNRGQLPGV